MTTAPDLTNSFTSKLEHKRAIIFLTNGVKLTGTITEHDSSALILEREGTYQLIRLAAVATFMPVDNFGN